MFEKIFKAICSDFGLFEDTIFLVVSAMVVCIWEFMPIDKTAKILTCSALFVAIIVMSLLCRFYFAKIAKNKGIKFVTNAKPSYTKEKWITITFFAIVGICIISYLFLKNKFDMLFAIVFVGELLLFLWLVLWLEKWYFRKRDKGVKAMTKAEEISSVEFATDEEVMTLGSAVIEENREAFEVLAQ